MRASLFIAVLFAAFLPILFAFLPMREWRAAEEKARARRLAGHRMNARLLRLDV